MAAIKQLEEFAGVGEEMYLRKIKEYVEIRKKFKGSYKTLSQINVLWRKRIKHKKLRNLKDYYQSMLKKHPKLDDKNFATFRTKIFKNGQLVDEVVEFAHSGSKRIEGFIERIKDEDFLKDVFDLSGRMRKNDSELKYIYHFITNHMSNGDYFIVETTNIMTACSSCRQEFLILKELFGDKIKIVVNSLDELETVQDVKTFVK